MRRASVMPLRSRHSMARSRRVMAENRPAPWEGFSKVTPPRSRRPSAASRLNSSSPVSVTWTPVGMGALPLRSFSRIAARTLSMLVPLSMYSWGSTSKSRQTAMMSVIRCRSASTA